MHEGHALAAPAIRDWLSQASSKLQEEEASVPPTPLIELKLGMATPVIIKDETAHPTQSLKHRVARSLFQFGLCNGLIGPNTHIVEASSGSAAISEAYFARALGLEFTALVPASTARAKIEAIIDLGGNVEFVPAGQDLADAAASFAEPPDRLFLDQFLNAERASCWRGSGNIASELLAQLESQGRKPPAWIVVGAGTGGTSSSIARHLRLRGVWGRTRLCVVDPLGSIFFRQFSDPDCAPGGTNSDFIEGIGRKRPSPSFIPSLVDRMIEVPDEASIGAAHWLKERQALGFGPSTGTNLIGALALAQSPASAEDGIVLLGCDPAHRYETTIFNSDWLGKKAIDPDPWVLRCEALASGRKSGFDGVRITRHFRGPPENFG
jgi:cysteine synthase A